MAVASITVSYDAFSMQMEGTTPEAAKATAVSGIWWKVSTHCVAEECLSKGIGKEEDY